MASDGGMQGAAEHRLARLLAVTGELAGASTREDLARIAIEQGIAAVGATHGGLWLLDEAQRHLALVAVSELPRGSADPWSQVAIDADVPLTQVVRTGAPLYLESLDDYRARFPDSFARIQPTISHAELAYAMVPLCVGGSVLGAMSLTYANAGRIDDSARAFLEILARQCGLALERVRLREIERAARAEAELLYELTAACNRIEELGEIYDLALATVERGTASDRSAILLFDDANVMRFEAAHGLSVTYRDAVEGHSPWTRDTPDPRPVLVDDTETDPAWTGYRDTFRAEGVRALAFVPLLHHGALLGKFMLYRNAPRAFSPAEIKVAGAIAAHVAQAVVRVRHERELDRAFREERAAHLEAEAATRAREEILSVVSHDLRNPLGTIIMGAGTILAGIEPSRVPAIAERIQRQGERMARLIGDLVDFAGIQAGRLAIERTPQAPSAILAQTSDLYRPLAVERGLLFDITSDSALPSVPCDPDRAVQILGNLVSNAIKVTPPGGSIVLGAHPGDDGESIVFFVRDTGPGIAADELPSLFERYWRSKQSSYRGAGLGLSIARGLVEAHGGRIWAESRIGAGSTFFFSLTATRN